MPVEYKGRLKSRIPDIIRQLDPQVNLALVESAEEVARIARFLVPKETGRLMEAIHVERRYDHGKVVTYVVAGDRQAWYGHIVEHGATHKGKRSHGHTDWTGRVAARPFLVPAAEASRKFIVNAGRDAIQRAVD
jgi:Bacteriophage HK97-gp10, putative tail-component